MAEQGREVSHQEQDCLSCPLQVKLKNISGRHILGKPINYHPQSGWYDESPQRGLDTKALLTSSAPVVSPLAPGS
jgi:hypothetical protein